MHSRCLTKCQRHLGSSWSGQNLQISVSLGAGDGGQVSLSNIETCQCKNLRKPILDRTERLSFYVLNILQQVHSPGLKGFVGRTIGRKKNHVQQSNKKWICSRKGQTSPESKRGCFAQILQITFMGFYIKMNYMHLLPSPNT